ncbi:MAG: hypothetical protein JWM36_3611 [Hyphomicrobiales bacterium]|nr:hypothetical protein [Hyphomicrobiales bacterium]
MFMAVIGHSAPALAAETSASLKVGVTLISRPQAKQTLSGITTRIRSRTTQVSRAREAAPPAPALSTISLIYK